MFIPGHKQQESKDLNDQIEEFFAKGGKIEQVQTLSPEEWMKRERANRKKKNPLTVGKRAKGI